MFLQPVVLVTKEHLPKAKLSQPVVLSVSASEPTAVLFSETGKRPAEVLKDFRKGNEMPVLKAAYIDSEVIAGDNQIDYLSTLKSKEDLIADLIALLQSPMSNLMGALNSGGSTIHGLLKALEERDE